MIHQNSILVLCHDDLSIDITHRRMNGEKGLIANLCLPRYKQGRVNMVVMAVGGLDKAILPTPS